MYESDGFVEFESTGESGSSCDEDLKLESRLDVLKKLSSRRQKSKANRPSRLTQAVSKAFEDDDSDDCFDNVKYDAMQSQQDFIEDPDLGQEDDVILSKRKERLRSIGKKNALESEMKAKCSGTRKNGRQKRLETKKVLQITQDLPCTAVTTPFKSHRVLLRETSKSDSQIEDSEKSRSSDDSLQIISATSPPSTSKKLAEKASNLELNSSGKRHLRRTVNKPPKYQKQTGTGIRTRLSFEPDHLRASEITKPVMKQNEAVVLDEIDDEFDCIQMYEHDEGGQSLNAGGNIGGSQDEGQPVYDLMEAFGLDNETPEQLIQRVGASVLVQAAIDAQTKGFKVIGDEMWRGKQSWRTESDDRIDFRLSGMHQNSVQNSNHNSDHLLGAPSARAGSRKKPTNHRFPKKTRFHAKKNIRSRQNKR